MFEKEPSNFSELKIILDKNFMTSLLDFAYGNKDELNTKDINYMSCYSAISSYCDKGIDNNREMFAYHNKIINDYLKYCYKILINKKDEEFIDEFTNLTDKINLIIYCLKRIFTYLDRFFTKSYIHHTLCYTSIRQYERELFLPFKDKLYEKLNKLIRDDRNGHIESRDKIKKILDIINYLDFSNVQFDKGKIIILLEGNNIDKAIRKKEWFENYFMKETIKYLEEKAKNDMKNLSINDYIDTQLKYLKKENERKQLYIYPQFHEQLDNLNYLYLIGNNSKELLNKFIGNSFNIDDLNKTEVKNLYQFLKLYPESLCDISPVFKRFIKEKFEAIFKKNNSKENPQAIINEIKEFKESLNLLINECFDNEENLKRDINNLVKLCLIEVQNEENNLNITEIIQNLNLY